MAPPAKEVEVATVSLKDLTLKRESIKESQLESEPDSVTENPEKMTQSYSMALAEEKSSIKEEVEVLSTRGSRRRRVHLSFKEEGKTEELKVELVKDD